MIYAGLMVDQANEGAWAPIEIEDRNVATRSRSDITLTFQLSAKPDEDWARLFQSSPFNKSGSMDYVMSPVTPRLQDSSILFDVPDSALENAIAVVESAVASTNARYQSEAIPRQKAAKDHAAKEAQAEADRIADLNRRLGKG